MYTLNINSPYIIKKKLSNHNALVSLIKVQLCFKSDTHMEKAFCLYFWFILSITLHFSWKITEIEEKYQGGVCGYWEVYPTVQAGSVNTKK